MLPAKLVLRFDPRLLSRSRLCFVLAMVLLSGSFNLHAALTPAIETGTPNTNQCEVSSTQSSLGGEAAREYLLSQGVFEQVRAAEQNRSLAALIDDGRIHFTNRAQRLSAHIDETGFEIHTRSPDGSITYQTRWMLTSIALGDAQVDVTSGRLHADGTRGEIQRNELGIVEWFENTRDGLEHGFTLARPPVPAATDSTLRLEMTVKGDLRAVVDESGQHLSLSTASGETLLSYDKLAVWDANGTTLASQMATTGDRIVLTVNTVGARYPLTIDPTFTYSQQAYLKASNAGDNDSFGYSVAIDADTIVVGAPRESGDASSTIEESNDAAYQSGAAYIFVRSGSTWSQQAYLKVSDPATNDAFGSAVAIEGDTVVVGAPTKPDVNNTLEAGSTYVFTRSGSTWTEQARLASSSPKFFGHFGSSVAISGETVVVGSDEFYQSTGIGPGKVDVFTRSGSTWSHQTRLEAFNPGNGARFGKSVAIDGDTIVVGADQEYGDSSSTVDNPNSNTTFAGAAYVFVRSDSTWSQQAYLKAFNAESHDSFGTAVAVSGDTVVIGATSEAGDQASTIENGNNNALNAGAAYVYARSGSAWSLQAYLKASNAEEYDLFGSSVAIAEDILLVGARQEGGNSSSTAGAPNNNAYAAGAAYLFVRTGSTWSQAAYLKASNAGMGDVFGTAMALSGSSVVVGAKTESGDSSSTAETSNDNSYGAGAAYVIQIAPQITSVAVPDNGSYKVGDSLTFTVRFSTTIEVIGTPSLPITIGATSHEAVYTSGSGTNTLAFNYTIQASDSDPDGIVLTSPLDLNGGSIKSESDATDAGLTFTAPDTSAVLVDNTAPSLSSISRQLPVEAATAANRVLFRVLFDESVTGVDTADFSVHGDATGTVSSVINSSGRLYYVWVTGITGFGDLRLDLVDSASVTDVAGNSIGSDGFSEGQSFRIIGSTAAFAWGSVYSGKLGNNGNTDADSPVAVNTSGALAGKTIIDIDAGDNFSLALASDGTAYAWGDNYYGGLGDGTNISSEVPVAVDTAGALSGKNLVAIDAGSLHGVALADDGTVYSWGLGYNGRLGDGTTTNRNAPVAVNMSGVLSGKTIIDVAAGLSHTLALASDGTLYGWGSDENGRLGNGASPRNNVDPVAVDMTGVLAGKLIVQIIAGPRQSFAIDSDGALYAWGDNDYGKLGNADDGDQTSPARVVMTGVLAGKQVVGVASGNEHTVAVTADGGLYSWGRGFLLGRDGNTTSNVPVAVETSGVLQDKVVVAVGAAPTTSFAIDAEGVAYAWGESDYGELGDGTGDNFTLLPRLVDKSGALDGRFVTRVAGGISDDEDGNEDGYFALALAGVLPPTITSVTSPTDGSYKEGAPLSFTVDFSSAVTVTGTPQLAFTLGTTEVTATYASGSGTTALVFTYTVQADDTDSDGIELTSPLDLDGGTIRATGTTLDAKLDFTAPDTSAVLVDAIAPTVETIARHLPFEPETAATRVLYRVQFDESVTGVDLSDFELTTTESATGSIDSIINDSGKIYWVWVTETSGAGDLRLDVKATPTIADSAGNTAVASGYTAGETYSLVDRATSIHAWGNNDDGILGNGTSGEDNSAFSPVAVDLTGILANKTIIQVSAGGEHALALASDGTIYAWGNNATGALGDGTFTSSSTPVAVSMDGVLAGHTIIAISAGGNHSLALSKAGKVFSWGYRGPGLLGDGITDTNSNIPVAVTTDGALAGKTIVSIAAASGFNLALASDGTAYTWGWGRFASLGNGQTADSAVPVAVRTDGVLAGKAIVSISTGISHAHVIASDGTAYGWGDNQIANIGDGTRTSRPSPAAVYSDGALAEKSLRAISGGYVFSFGLASDDSLFAWGGNEGGFLSPDAADGYVLTPVASPLRGTLQGKSIRSIAAAESNFLALDSNGFIHISGANPGGSLGIGNEVENFFTPEPVLVSTFPGSSSLAGQRVISLGTPNNGAKSYSLVLAYKVAPTIASVSRPAAANYQVGTKLSFKVEMDESVTVDTTHGSPRLPVVIGETTVYATYDSENSDDTVLVFSYTVQAGDSDSDGISLTSPLEANGASITSNDYGAAAWLDFTAPDTSEVLVAVGPDAPSAPDLAAASDTGDSDTDNVTKDDTPTVTGTAETGTTVKLYDTDGTTLLGSATATDGTWSITSTALDEGEHTLTATATDADDNPSMASESLTIIIDTTAPSITSAGTTSLTYGNGIAYTITATGSATSFGGSDLGDQITVNASTGVLAGTPSAAGTIVGTVSATDAAGNTASIGLTITVNRATLDIEGLLGTDKVYDGNTTATIDASKVQLIGVVGEDVVSLDLTDASAAFVQTDATSQMIIVTDLALGGADAANYTLRSTTASTFANISPKAVTLSGVTAVERVYDGTFDVALDFANAALDGALAGDVEDLEFSTANATGTLQTKSAGAAKEVTVTGVNFDGPASPNYVFNQPSDVTVDITAKSLTVTGLTIETKTYDGTTDASLGTTDAALVGVLQGDIVGIAFNEATAEFDSAGIGTDKPVTIAGIAASGTHGGNYTVTQPTGLTADITAAVITVAADPIQRPYGDPNPELTFSYSGFVNGEDESVITGEPVLATDATRISAIGEYTTTVDVGPLSATNYTFAAINAAFDVTPGYHSADTDRNYRISLGELLRVIELYNHRAGTVRTGEYRSNDSTADRYEPGPGTRILPHTADSDADGRISLIELTRIIELYNYREDNARTGAYRYVGDTEDGFSPGSTER